MCPGRRRDGSTPPPWKPAPAVWAGVIVVVMLITLHDVLLSDATSLPLAAGRKKIVLIKPS